ncbi:DUF29 family protein [Rippkaea orientalis]|uniref:DUF29 family protein n=1 Tax=Rippkaea orientalis TaxID=2546366 RepID=UPI0002D5F3E4|nr:DUF29 family protein [Rippkaea orientalis]
MNLNFPLEKITKLKARKRAIHKTKLSPNIFAENCPFTSEQLLDVEFFPQENNGIAIN